MHQDLLNNKEELLLKKMIKKMIKDILTEYH
jgi:hypothetical protein